MLTLRCFFVEVFPNRLAIGVKNLETETIKARLQAIVCTVPDNNAGKVLFGTKVDFPKGGRIAVIVVGDALGFVEVAISNAVNGEFGVAIMARCALASLGSEG